MILLNDIMHDGSRNFIILPVGNVSPLKLAFKVLSLRGAYPTAFIPSLAETWIDFRYQKNSFSINDQFGDYWFFVKDPECAESILNIVVSHFEKVLNVNS